MDHGPPSFSITIAPKALAELARWSGRVRRKIVDKIAEVRPDQLRKLQPHERGLWACRIVQGLRAIFSFRDDDTAMLVHIGARHDGEVYRFIDTYKPTQFHTGFSIEEVKTMLELRDPRPDRPHTTGELPPQTERVLEAQPRPPAGPPAAAPPSTPDRDGAELFTLWIDAKVGAAAEAMATSLKAEIDSVHELLNEMDHNWNRSWQTLDKRVDSMDAEVGNLHTDFENDRKDKVLAFRELRRSRSSHADQLSALRVVDNTLAGRIDELKTVANRLMLDERALGVAVAQHRGYLAETVNRLDTDRGEVAGALLARVERIEEQHRVLGRLEQSRADDVQAVQAAKGNLEAQIDHLRADLVAFTRTMASLPDRVDALEAQLRAVVGLIKRERHARKSRSMRARLSRAARALRSSLHSVFARLRP
jgi:hypothetical protein